MIWGGSDNSGFRSKAFFNDVEVKKNAKLLTFHSYLISVVIKLLKMEEKVL